jgi:hypothetical protein
MNKTEVPTLTANQLQELDLHFTTTQVEATAATMVNRIFPAIGCAHIMHVDSDITLPDDRYTPARQAAFKAGWYFDSGEWFGGPFQNQTDAEVSAKYMLKHWEDYCKSYQSYVDSGLI